MAQKNNSTSTSSGGIGLTGLIAGIYAYSTIPALTGLKGAFAAAMIGGGTSLTSTIYGMGGALVGITVGGAVGGLIRGDKGARTGMMIGGYGLAIAAGISGIPKGYGLAKDIVLNGVELDTSEISLMLEENDQTASLDIPLYVIDAPD